MITFNGNYAEIGKQMGEYYKENGISFGRTKIDEELLEKQLEVYKKYYPELLVELEATADKAGFDKKAYIYRRICGEINWFRNRVGIGKACTIFGITNENGALVGRNYDWSKYAGKAFQTYKSNNPQCFSTITVTDMEIDGKREIDKKRMFFSPDDAINEKGLYIGLTFAYSHNWNYGINSIWVIKRIAETCETVEEAIKFFNDTPVSCPKNFFVADRFGNMAVIEHTSKAFRVRKPENGNLIITNHYVNKEMSKEDEVLTHNPFHNTFERYEEVSGNLINRPNMKFCDVNEIICGKCAKTLQNNPKLQTIWSLSLDMTNQKYKIHWDIFNNEKEGMIQF